jgi:hypothetical protein
MALINNSDALSPHLPYTLTFDSLLTTIANDYHDAETKNESKPPKIIVSNTDTEAGSGTQWNEMNIL